MNKRPSIAEAKPTLSESLDRLRAARPEGGLANLAGGWEGSEELAALLSESHRRGRRVPPALE